MYIVVFVTTKNVSEAKKVAKKLLDEKLVACANVVKEVDSFFWWQKKIDSARESMLILKSQKRLFKKLVKAVKAVHSYDVPEIIALPIVEGNEDYLKWIKDSTN